MSTTEVRLTPKQQAVYDQFAQGKTPAEVAKKLKLSRTGVYGHMRKIRDAGLTLPTNNGKAQTNGGEPVPMPVDTETQVEPADALRDAIARCEDQLAELEAAERQAEERLKAVTQLHERVTVRRDRFSKAFALVTEQE